MNSNHASHNRRPHETSTLQILTAQCNVHTCLVLHTTQLASHGYSHATALPSQHEPPLQGELAKRSQQGCDRASMKQPIDLCIGSLCSYHLVPGKDYSSTTRDAGTCEAKGHTPICWRSVSVAFLLCADASACAAFTNPLAAMIEADFQSMPVSQACTLLVMLRRLVTTLCSQLPSNLCQLTTTYSIMFHNTYS